MKKLLYLFILLMIAGLSVKSQSISDRYEGWAPKYPPDDENSIEGTRNLYDDFRPGKVYYIDNSDVLQVSLRLNLYNDEFEYVKNDTLYVLEHLNRLEKIEFDNHRFIYVEPKSKTVVSGFVVIWNDELPAVLTKMKVGYYAKEIAPFGKPLRFERDEDRHFIVNAEGQYEQIYSVKKLIKYLSTHQEELSRFAKKEKISSNDPKELAKLLDYYRTLHQNL